MNVREVTKKAARPRGNPDECFFCKKKIGDLHTNECLEPRKTVQVRFTVEVKGTMPDVWENQRIEEYLNNDDWRCKGDLREVLLELMHEKRGCMCKYAHAEVVTPLADKPRREATDAGCTSGDWRVEKGNAPLGDTGDYESFATIMCGSTILAHVVEGEHQVEDAHIMAAAQDLLTVLKAERKGTPCGDDCAGGWRHCIECDRRLKAAIAKAESHE